MTFTATLALTASMIQAQDTPTYHPHFLNARVLSSGGRISDGYVYALSDTALLLSRSKRFPDLYDTAAHEGIQNFSYHDLRYVTVHKSGGTARSVLLGLCIGAATGAIIGYVSGDDPTDQWFALTASQKAFAVGTFGGIVGALTGLIVGVAGHRTFVIKGKKEKFDYMSRRLAARIGY